MRSLERRISQVHCVRPFEDWGKLLGDVPAATAILDRFLHHAEVITITGKSYRLHPPAEGTPENSKPAISPNGSEVENPPRTGKKKAEKSSGESCEK